MKTKAELLAQRADTLALAEAMKGADGAFKDDATRAAFDAKMAEIDAIDAQVRALPAETVPDAATIERERITGIQSAVRTAKLPDAFGADLVERGVDINAARAAVINELARISAADTKGANVNITMGEDATDKALRGASNWMLVKAGAAASVAAHTKQPVGDAGEFRGMTLLDLARHFLEIGGTQVRGLSKMDLVARAFTTRGSITQSTSDFTVLLENVMHKILQASFAITPDTWSRFCAVGSVSDFRAHNRYRLGNFSGLDTVAENGEFKNKSIPDAEKESITATTKGNIINVSRQMIINDDMGGFSLLLSQLGRAAKLSVERDVYALLALNSGLGPTLGDSVAMFDAAHANISTGAALTAAAIDADRVKMAQQMDQNSNEYLDLRPAILVLAVGLGGQARIINQSVYDPDTVANKAQMKPNAVVGLFRDIVDTPRLGSSTRRYLFADPAIAPVIEVAFLEGQSEPVIETQDGWRVDGTEMKVRYDYAVGGVGYHGAVTNAGQ
jgi:hypothetical protein